MCDVVSIFDEYISELNKYCQSEPSNEELLRSIEECIDISEQGTDDFRRGILAFWGHIYYNTGNIPTIDSIPTLNHAIKIYCKKII
jgi:predicted Ser/Thr protein kinase